LCQEEKKASMAEAQGEQEEEGEDEFRRENESNIAGPSSPM
jgi:hypothetical protein